MTLAVFTFTRRARPFVELGIGDTRVPISASVWDGARWDAAGSTWAGNEPTWVDVTCDAFSFRVEYGRRRTTDRFVVGVGTVLLDNSSGWADPDVVSPPHVLTVRPGRAIRLGVDHAVYGRRVLFRGFVDSVTPTYTPHGSADTVELGLIDALGEVNRAKVTPEAVPVGAGDTVDARIARLLDLAQWSQTKRDLAPTGDTLIADDLGGQLADLLGQAADSGGGSVYGDLEARIAYRPRDWQTYTPGTPVDGTIGNVDLDGEPGYEIPGTPAVPSYLTPTAGYVTTTDPGNPPAQSVLVARLLGPSSGDNTVAAQWQTAASNRSSIYVARPDAARLYYSTTGADQLNANAPQAAPSSTDPEEWGWAVDRTAGTLTPWRRPAGGTWTAGTPATVPPFALFDSTLPLSIGATSSGAVVFGGRIYSVELRTGLDPAGGSVLWRFDPAEYPSKMRWTVSADTLDTDANADGIADGWVAHAAGPATALASRTMVGGYQRLIGAPTAAGAAYGVETSPRITVMDGGVYRVTMRYAGVPTVSGQGQLWAQVYTAAGASVGAAVQITPPSSASPRTVTLDIVAGVGGVALRVIPRIVATGTANGTGPMTLDVHEVTVDYIGPANYLDARGRTWNLTGGGITPAVAEVPPVWVPPVAGDVCPVQWERPFARADMATRVIIGRDPATAIVLDDIDAQTLYGVEPFERTDLLTESDSRLAMLAERYLRTRSAATSPRVRSVSLDARTSDAALDLMSTVDVYLPSRYRCRLLLDRGLVFDEEHFATGVVHEVTPRGWALDLNLDLAAPFAASGGRWDGAYWDQSTWADAAAVLDEALELLSRNEVMS